MTRLFFTASLVCWAVALGCSVAGYGGTACALLVIFGACGVAGLLTYGRHSYPKPAMYEGHRSRFSETKHDANTLNRLADVNHDGRVDASDRAAAVAQCRATCDLIDRIIG